MRKRVIEGVFFEAVVVVGGVGNSRVGGDGGGG